MFLARCAQNPGEIDRICRDTERSPEDVLQVLDKHFEGMKAKFTISDDNAIKYASVSVPRKRRNSESPEYIVPLPEKVVKEIFELHAAKVGALLLEKCQKDTHVHDHRHVTMIVLVGGLAHSAAFVTCLQEFVAQSIIQYKERSEACSLCAKSLANIEVVSLAKNPRAWRFMVDPMPPTLITQGATFVNDVLAFDVIHQASHLIDPVDVAEFDSNEEDYDSEADSEEEVEVREREEDAEMEDEEEESSDEVIELVRGKFAGL